MAFIPINFQGTPGIIRDERPHLLPPTGWTDGRNVRMNDRSVIKMRGHEQVYNPPTVAPIAVWFVPGTSVNFWVYTGLQKIYVWNGSAHTNITRQTASIDVNYTGDVDTGWNGGVLSGILVVNNGVDTPQMWNPPATSTKMQEITAWPSSTTCKVIRPFGKFLVALDITKSGTRYPYMVKWSHPADPGSVPSSWDETDATKDAGEYDLGETEDFLVDCLPLRNANIIYKERTTFTQQFIGGTFVFNLLEISRLDGMYARQCAVEFRPGYHCVLTQTDLVIHNGVTAESVIDGKNRDFLFGAIDGTNYQRTFLFHNERWNEVWVCYPEAGQTECTAALVWNYRENTFGHRTLPNILDAKMGLVAVTQNDQWNSGEAIDWNSTGELVRWDQVEGGPNDYKPLWAGYGDTKLYKGDAPSYDANGTAFESWVERTGLAVSGLNRDGSITLNFESFKFLRGVRPRFAVTPSQSMQMYIGVQDHINDTPDVSGPFTMSPENEFKVDCTLSGRLFSIKITDNSQDYWELDGLDLDIDVDALY